MKLQSINEEHEILIRRYINFIKGVAYEATEDCEYGKFDDYFLLFLETHLYT